MDIRKFKERKQRNLIRTRRVETGLEITAKQFDPNTREELAEITITVDVFSVLKDIEMRQRALVQLAAQKTQIEAELNDFQDLLAEVQGEPAAAEPSNPKR